MDGGIVYASRPPSSKVSVRVVGFHVMILLAKISEKPLTPAESFSEKRV